MNIWGYVRVSCNEQNEDRQVLDLLEKGVVAEHIYMDKLSGKDFNRPKYKALISKLCAGDLLYIKSIDRLGRDYEEIQRQWRVLTKDIRADICVIDMPLLDTRTYKDLMGTFISDMVLQILSFVAHSERENIRQRQAEGIAAARARGKHLGRPEKTMPENFEDMINKWEKKQISREMILKECNISKSTFYRKIHTFHYLSRVNKS